MKKSILIFLVICILVTHVGCVTITVKEKNDISRKPEEEIRLILLEIFPKGTHMEDTIEKIRSEYIDWEIWYIDHDSGYGIDHKGIPGEIGQTMVGSQSIRVEMGEDVVVFFGFDADSKLVDISVRKDVDSL